MEVQESSRNFSGWRRLKLSSYKISTNEHSETHSFEDDIDFELCPNCQMDLKGSKANFMFAASKALTKIAKPWVKK